MVDWFAVIVAFAQSDHPEEAEAVSRDMSDDNLRLKSK